MEFEERYFREELDYLRQLSKLLATEKPHLARFLAEKDADPDIERLLEGVAFLTGNLRQKIEDEFPELTHGLIKMLWPNYLRPVPAMTLIEYTPDMDKSSVPVLIPVMSSLQPTPGKSELMKCCPLMLKRRSRLPVPSLSAGISGCCPFAWSRLKTAVRPVMVLSTSPFRSHRERTSARWI